MGEASVRQLRLLLALSEELHFGRTAGRLHITQSALSQQIRDLEKRWGLRLFERDSRSVSLTAAGRTMLREARSVVEALDQLRRTADAQRRQICDRLVVGTIAAESAMFHTRAILEFLRDRHPELTVEMRNLNFADHIAALQRREVDVVFLRPPVPDGIELCHLATEPRVACIAADDPLAARSEITLARLNGHPVVDMPPQVPRAWWDFWAVDPRPDGSPVRYGPVVADMEGLLHAVSRREAMCFLPASARDFFPRPGIAYLDVTDLEPCTSAVAWLADSQSDRVVTAVREAAQAFTRGREGARTRADPGSAQIR